MTPTASRSSGRPGPALLVTLAVLAVVGVFFYNGQNVAGHIGGAISLPKMFWLVYALSTFFVMPFFLWRDERVAPVLRRLYRFQFINWIVRGLAELWLMYGLHAWIPPYGAWHGEVTIAVLMALQWRWWSELKQANSYADRTAKGFMVQTMVTGVTEIYFAWAFYRLADFDTTKTWFANDGAKWQFINHATTVADVAGYLCLAYIVWRYYRAHRPVLRPAEPALTP